MTILDTDRNITGELHLTAERPIKFKQMKTKNNVLLIAVVLALLSMACANKKTATSPEQLAKLQEMVDSNAFRLDAQWANPLATQGVNAIAVSGLLPLGRSTPNRIDIFGTPSYIEFKNDSVFAILPYYGERQFMRKYPPTDAGIRFKGVPRDLEIAFDEKKRQYNFNFDIKSDTGEGFTVNGILFGNMNTTFYINSTDRLSIAYSGSIKDPVDRE